MTDTYTDRTRSPRILSLASLFLCPFSFFLFIFFLLPAFFKHAFSWSTSTDTVTWIASATAFLQYTNPA